MAASSDYDVVIVGAGLSGLYTARCLRRVNASLRILIVEGAPAIGGRVRCGATHHMSATLLTLCLIPRPPSPLPPNAAR